MILWMTWTWTWLLEAYFWIPLFKQQFILDKTVSRIYDSWRNTFGTVWDRYSMKMENWSVNKMKSLVQGLLISKVPRGCRHAYCAKKLVGSVLCVGKVEMTLLQPGRGKIECCSENSHFKDMNRIDGMPTEFEWKIFPGIIEKIDSKSNEKRPTVWTWALQWQDHLHVNVQRHCLGRTRNTEICEYNSQTVAKYARKFPRGHWSLLGPGSEKKWCWTYSDKPDGSWDQTAENMMSNFSESGHPIFRASSAFERGELRSKEHGQKSIHFNGSDDNIELLLRTVISANELSVYRTIAILCNELSEGFGAVEKPEAPDHFETLAFSKCRNSYQCTAAVKLGARIRAKIRTIVRNQKLSKLCSDAGSKLVERGQYFKTKDNRCNIFAENTRCLETKRRLV